MKGEKEMENLRNLLTVKSLVTLVLTLVFAYMAVVGEVSQNFMTIYAVIISFYFGTQAAKKETGQSGTDVAADTGEDSVDAV